MTRDDASRGHDAVRGGADVPTPGELQSGAIRGSLWIGLATLVNFPVALLGTVIAARALGPSGFGRYTLVVFLYTSAMLALDLGVGAATAWRVSAASVTDRVPVEEAVSSYIGWNLVKTPFFAGIGFFLMGKHLTESIAFVVIVTLILYLTTLQLALSADRRFKAASRLEMLRVFVWMTSLAAASVITHDYRVAFLCGLGAQALVIPFAAAAARSDIRRASLRPRRLRLGRPLREYAAASYVSVLTEMWVFGRSESVFLGATRQFVDQGRFGAATAISSRVTLLSDSLYASLDATLVALRSTRGDALHAALRRVTQLGCVIGILTSVVVMPPAVFIAPLFFGSQYHGLAGPIVALTIASVVYTGINPLSAWLAATRRSRAIAIPRAAAAVVDGLLSLLLIPDLGLRGAVIASVSATGCLVLGLIVVGVGSMGLRLQLLRNAAYLAGIGLLAGATCLAARGLGFWAGIIVSYAATGAASFVVLRFVFPPVAEPSDVAPLVAIAPARARPYVQGALGVFTR